MVYVLNSDGSPLMPCTETKARHLIEGGKANQAARKVAGYGLGDKVRYAGQLCCIHGRRSLAGGARATSTSGDWTGQGSMREYTTGI